MEALFLSNKIRLSSDSGGVVEWFKAAVLKTAVGFTVHRGFESLPLRQASLPVQCRQLKLLIFINKRVTKLFEMNREWKTIALDCRGQPWCPTAIEDNPPLQRIRWRRYILIVSFEFLSTLASYETDIIHWHPIYNILT